MKKLRNIFLFLALVLTAPIGYAIWPTVDVVTTNLDSDTDSLTAARADLNDLAIKFNQVIGHVSTFMRTVLDDADAAAARTTLGAASTGVNVFNGSQSVTGSDANFGAGGNRTVIDFANGNARIGSVNGGGSAAGTQILSNGASALAFDNSGGAQFQSGSKGIQAGSPTGGDKGAGTINAANTIYQNNVPVITTAGGALTGPLSSTKACASGYTRVGPNFCARGGGSSSTLGRDVCTTIAAPASEANALIIKFTLDVRSANSQAARFADVTRYTSSACSVTNGQVANASAYEFSALAAGSVSLSRVDAHYLVLLSSSGADSFFSMTDDAGDQSFVFFRIIGYMD